MVQVDINYYEYKSFVCFKTENLACFKGYNIGLLRKDSEYKFKLNSG